MPTVSIHENGPFHKDSRRLSGRRTYSMKPRYTGKVTPEMPSAQVVGSPLLDFQATKVTKVTAFACSRIGHLDRSG